MTIKYLDSKRISASSAEYKVHSFTSGGTFTVTGSGDVEYLVVAGGGAGIGQGTNGGGGGGAGGYRTATGHAVTAQSYTITVGGGGTGGSGTATSGSDSVFDTITSEGGGVTWTGSAASPNAGSGGGGFNAVGGTGQTGNNPVTSPAQGTNGGNTSWGTEGGGGGGSGTAGSNATSSSGGNGGSGGSSSITGSAVTRAGGGGGGSGTSGGTGGSGGGGAGQVSGAGVAGTTNTGSGGGAGRGGSNVGGNGGTGIVIIRYLTSSSITATGGTITTISVADTKPTNVQDNSILVEKDTGNRFWFSDDVLETITATGTYVYSQEAGAFGNNKVGFHVATTSSALHGKTIDSVSFWLAKIGSPTGTAYIRAYSNANSGGANTQVHEFGSIDVSTLTQGSSGMTSGWTKYTFNTGSHTLAQYDTVGLEWNGSGSSSTNVSMQGASSDQYDSTNIVLGRSNPNPSPRAYDIKFEVINIATPATWTWENEPVLPTVSGLILHIDASDASTITKDGSNLVWSWNDKSGQGNNLTEATNKPLWVNSVYNSRPTIRFDGVNDALKVSSFSGGSSTQPTTVFIVCTMPSSNTKTVFDSVGTGTRSLFQRSVGGQYLIYAGINPVFGTMNTAFAQYNVLLNTTASEVRRDKTSIGVNMNIGTQAFNGISLGSSVWDVANFGDIDVSEVVIYDNDISDTDRDLIEAYLETKWGL